MITGVHLDSFFRTASPPLPSPFLLTPFLSAFSPLPSAGPFVSGSAYLLFIPPCSFFFAPRAFFFRLLGLFVVLVCTVKKKKRSGRYALSYLGFSLLLLPSRHFRPPVSSASRACGTPPHAVLLLRVFLRGAAVLRSRCRLEWPCARRSIRIWRYYRGRMAGHTPKSKGRLALF